MKSHLIGLIPDFKVIRFPLFISGLLSGIAGKVETARRFPKSAGELRYKSSGFVPRRSPQTVGRLNPESLKSTSEQAF